ncbi:hypothetical protein [Mucilaginibacter sp. L3T2-6]|uniref:hypothetical protein n=1 Tax=Mucilaginibacter sp. L3T2-6 TaxID=3062491 RepID=UPI0026747369|nr:hypothetical protein [Mucilaginibacter sp. L3T2-6]MDO3645225.1 hypothetical protein [Mucilaginibacter sp. L3T2-6]MDV6217677.1 hypothetical protein [Mucilaginibacter sp. L3T2-6]
MKNKATLYILGAAVAIVWGLIIYRVYDSVGSGDDGVVAGISKPAKEAFNDYTVPADTTHLLLNYRDPFSEEKMADTKVHVKISTAKPRAEKKVVAMNWGFITYSGYINNPVGKKFLAVMHINGKAVMLTEGETNQNVKLLKNMRDSVKVSFGGKIKVISMHASL